MSETNGHGESRLDRIEQLLDRVTASHVKLMTDHELAWAKHEKFVEQQDREWERQKELWKQRDAQYEVDRRAWKEADEALGKRITDLVSAFGDYIARKRG